MKVLQSKATAEELDDYRRFVVALAERVANAHKEGSFLGIGGTRISEKEQTALDAIAASVA